MSDAARGKRGKLTRLPKKLDFSARLHCRHLVGSDGLIHDVLADSSLNGTALINYLTVTCCGMFVFTC